MASLYQIIANEKSFKHLRCGIPSVDSILQETLSCGIHDIQSVPNVRGHFAILGALIASHLSNTGGSKVIVIDTYNPFPWHLVTCQPNFQKEWLRTRIKSFTADTFAKLFVLFAGGSLKGAESKNSLVIINNFHEMVELYCLDLMASYDEMLLKFQIDKNAVVLQNKERIRMEGFTSSIPDLPSHSGLLKDNPTLKYKSHLRMMIDLISRHSLESNLLCFLVGTLTTKYKLFETGPSPSQSLLSSSQVPSSQSSAMNTSFEMAENRTKGRLVLSTSLGEKEASTPGMMNVTPSQFDSFIDNVIILRLIFYKEWYHKTPQYLATSARSPKKTFATCPTSNLKMIQAVKVVNLQMPSQRFTPAFFDFSYEFEEDPNLQENEKFKNFNFEDFSIEPEIEGSQGTASNIRSGGASMDDDLSRSNILSVLESVPSSPSINISQVHDNATTSHRNSQMEKSGTHSDHNAGLGGQEFEEQEEIEFSDDDLVESILYKSHTNRG